MFSPTANIGTPAAKDATANFVQRVSALWASRNIGNRVRHTGHRDQRPSNDCDVQVHRQNAPARRGDEPALQILEEQGAKHERGGEKGDGQSDRRPRPVARRRATSRDGARWSADMMLAIANAIPTATNVSPE
jgi:hypothetical protein